MRKYLGLIIVFIFIIFFLRLVFNVKLGNVIQQKTEQISEKTEQAAPFPMVAKFDPSGTQVHDDYLLIRINFYPSPGQKTYNQQRIQIPVMPTQGYQGKVDDRGNPVNIDDYNNWIKGLPRIWRLNPVLNHFMKVDFDIARAKLETILKRDFDRDTLKQIDEILSQPTTELTQSSFKLLMSSKSGTGNKLPKEVDQKSIKEQINIRLANFEITVGQ